MNRPSDVPPLVSEGTQSHEVVQDPTTERKPADLATETLIGKDHATLTAGSPNETADDFAGRVSTMIGSPRGVMVLVPLLVLALGATLTIIGQTARGATSKKMARERFIERTTAVSLRLEQALRQVEPILDELARIARTEHELAEQGRPSTGPFSPRAETALEMRDLLIGRRAITQAYVAFPDGRFLSADPILPSGVEFQVTHLGDSISYRTQGQTLQRFSKQESDYDPRVRDWFRLATEKKTRIWSDPYSFYFNQHPGITRALPVYRDKEKTKLLAVVGVDFDVDALTEFMAEGESKKESAKSVVFTIPGVILAYPSGADLLADQPKGEKVATHGSLGDPHLSSLVSSVQGVPSLDRSREELPFLSHGKRMLASVRKVGAGGPDWYVATFAPEENVLRELHEHRKRSLWIGSVSLLVAMAMAWFLARHVLHVRKVATAARAAAKEAVDQMRVFGSYRLLSRIGEGGMGEVWRARHQLLARQAAIKLIKRASEDEQRHKEHQERFRREAQAIASLRSRNTVALFDYGLTPQGTLFYVMELLDGIDLSTLVSRHGAQPQERVRQILIQACNSLSEAHQAGLVHRDVKPANLFLCREASEVDVVKVLDFGLVFQVGLDEVETAHADAPTVSLSSPDLRSPDDAPGRITRPDHQLGTPAFMSPEQALGNETDGRSDLYSLACVAWWLLTARPLFVAPTQLALMLKHVEEEAPRLASAVDGDLDPKFQELVERCLAKSPDGRIQSALEFRRSLVELGPLDPPWDGEIAASWWQQHMPKNSDFQPRLTIAPLRDADVYPPPSAEEA